MAMFEGLWLELELASTVLATAFIWPPIVTGV